MKGPIVCILSILFLAIPAHAASVVQLRGEVFIGGTGTVPMTFLKASDGKSYEVKGPLEQELSQFGSGWVVELVGKVGQGSGLLPPPLTVYQYRVVEVKTPQGPRKPVLGRIMAEGDTLYLVGDNLLTYRLEGSLPTSLSGLEDGQRVGIVGQISGFGSNRKLNVEFYHAL